MGTFAANCLYVALGGALGALARYGLNVTLQAGTSFPWGTLSANLLGCFVMGSLAAYMASASWLHEAGLFPDHYRLLFAVGFCGSFTTLSSFVVELSALMERNEIALAFGYFVLTLGGGFACFWVALWVTRALLSLLTPGAP
ncbi:MAG TPA: fluoride efflux transporter CrcB [Woeseiaceae bacterium]|nr:fluoride efflux transporter CrcB [Woeseiaceae bacterium]